MKKQRLLLLFGGLLIMIMMTACKDSKIPENRTKKEYQAEQNFKSYFKYISDKNNYLDNIKVYYFSISISKDVQDKVSETTTCSYRLEKQKNQEFIGNFEHEVSESSQYSTEVKNQIQYPIQYKDNSIRFTEKTPSERYDEFVFSSFDSSFFIKQLNIKNPKKSSISVTKTESKEYYYTISIDTDSEIYSIFEGITLEDVKEFSK
ncbi:TPA: hypothetical protein ACGAXR_001514 [Streptococcus agalactiae]